MDTDKTCEICYLPINKNEKEMKCQFCGENFHELHLKVWLSIDGSCPICRKIIVEVNTVDADIEFRFKDHFNDGYLKPEWKLIDDEFPAFNLMFTGEGLQAIPLPTHTGLSYTEIQKELNSGTNNIRFIGQYNFDRNGFLFLSGYSNRGKQLFRLGIAKNIAVIHTKDPKYPSKAAYIPKIRTKNLLYIRFHLSSAKQPRNIIAIVYCPDIMLLDDYKLPDDIHSVRISFGKLGNEFSDQSIWKVFQYTELFLPDEEFFPQLKNRFSLGH